MKARMTATIAIAVVAMMVFAAAGATTFSWFTDTEETDITITTGSLKVETSEFDITHGNTSLLGEAAGTSIPTNITIGYDDGREAVTKWYTDKDSNVLSIAGNPGDVDIKIKYGVTFSGNLDYRYLIDVDYPDNMGIDISIMDKDGKKVDVLGSWVTADDVSDDVSLDVTYSVVISISSIPEDMDNDKIKITNMITQYLNPLWDGYIPEKVPSTLEIVPGGGTQTGTITINTPGDLVYLNTLAKEWVETYSNGMDTNVGSYRENVGGKGTDYYYHWAWDIILATDIDMNNIPMDSVDISYWDTFDGNGHTISNVVLNEGQDGLFNHGAKAINNLYIENIVVNAPDVQTVGAVAGVGTCTNVHVINADVTGGKYTGGIIGQGSSFINCSVKNSTVTGTDKTVGGLAGYSIGDPAAATVTGNIVENVVVTGAYNVGGLLGQSQNETVENNVVKDVTVISTRELPVTASANEVRTAELAARSNFANTVIGTNDTDDNVTLFNSSSVSKDSEFDDAIKGGNTLLVLGDGNYIIPDSAQGKTLTIKGNGDTVIATQDDGSYEGCDYSLDGSTVTFEDIVINTDSTTYTGYARMNGTYNNCIINGTYTLYGDSEFNNCTFNVSGDVYNIWTWGAPNATFNNCTFNSDGKALLLYGQANTKLTVNNCTFNDKGGLTDLKAAIEIGNDYDKSYELIVNDTTVNGYAINDKGINTGTTLWANKNSMGADKLNVVVDGVDVY